MKTQITSGFYLSAFLVLFFTQAISGQELSTKYDLYNLWKDNKFEVFNRQITQFSENGMKGIRFSGNTGDGVAWLKGVEFSNGIIELDIKGKDVLQESFVGIAFHGVDNTTFDAVYFRPFNFQSTDPIRKIHAVQYVSHPDFTWQVLREKYNGKYEKAVTPAPKGNDWFHAKILIQYPEVTVYVNGSNDPSLVIDKLNDRKNGKIGLWVGNNSDGDFANLQINNNKTEKK